MKLKMLLFALIVTSLFGYLEWGKNNHMFLFQVEMEILSKVIKNPLSVIHPMTVLPMAGQIALCYALLQKQVSRRLVYIGIGCLSLLFLMILFIGILSVNLKIFASTLPFLLTSIATSIYFRKNKPIRISP
jgi:hypothetical protein